MTFTVDNVKAFIEYVEIISDRNGILGPFYYPNTQIRQWNIIKIDDRFMLKLFKVSPNDHKLLIELNA